MASGHIILGHSGDPCSACCVGRWFVRWPLSLFVYHLSSFEDPHIFGTHTKTLMCINAKELAVRRKSTVTVFRQGPTHMPHPLRNGLGHLGVIILLAISDRGFRWV